MCGYGEKKPLDCRQKVKAVHAQLWRHTQKSLLDMTTRPLEVFCSANTPLSSATDDDILDGLTLRNEPEEFKSFVSNDAANPIIAYSSNRDAHLDSSQSCGKFASSTYQTAPANTVANFYIEEGEDHDDLLLQSVKAAKS